MVNNGKTVQPYECWRMTKLDVKRVDISNNR